MWNDLFKGDKGLMKSRCKGNTLCPQKGNKKGKPLGVCLFLIIYFKIIYLSCLQG